MYNTIYGNRALTFAPGREFGEVEIIVYEDLDGDEGSVIQFIEFVLQLSPGHGLLRWARDEYRR